MKHTKPSLKTCYHKLWKLLIDKEMTKSELRSATGLSPATVAKLTNGESVNTDVLLKICECLDCDISEIVSSTRKEGL